MVLVVDDKELAPSSPLSSETNDTLTSTSSVTASLPSNPFKSRNRPQTTEIPERSSTAEYPPAYESAASPVTSPTSEQEPALEPSPSNMNLVPQPSVPSPTPVVSLPDLPRSNCLRIHRNFLKIDGKWLIDTSLAISQYKEQNSDLEVPLRPNLQLLCDTGGINAEVTLAGGAQRAVLKASCTLGHVLFRLSNPRSQKVLMHLSCNTGQIKLALPRGFTGAVKIANKFGNYKFSSQFSRDLRIFSDESGRLHGFIGDFEAEGYGRLGEGEMWTGSELNIECKVGDIAVYYDDEKALAQKKDAEVLAEVPTPTSEPEKVVNTRKKGWLSRGTKAQ